MKNHILLRTLVQIVLWGGFWLLSMYIITYGWGLRSPLLERAYQSLLIISVIIIVNLNVLLPHLYFNGKKVLYILGGVFLYVIISILVYYDLLPWQSPAMNDVPEKMQLLMQQKYSKMNGGNNFPMMNPKIPMKWIAFFPPFIISFFGSTIVELALFASEKEKESIELEKEKLIAEIKFLKAQINPHFLFNALNNIYTLTLTQSKDAPKNLLRLSEILRYMVYDGSVDKVPLSKEVAYIKNYIALAQLKDSRGLNLKVDIDSVDLDLEVPTLLFIPFVENAFKHSKIEDLEKGWINIKLSTDKDKLYFSVSNSYFPSYNNKDTVGGIGLENVRKRLDLLYGDNYSLNIHQKDHQFDVALKLNNV